MESREVITRATVLCSGALVVILAVGLIFGGTPDELLPSDDSSAITGNVISTFRSPDTPTLSELNEGIIIRDSWYYLIWPEEAGVVPTEVAFASIINQNKSSHIGSPESGFWFNPEGKLSSYIGTKWDSLDTVKPGKRYTIALTGPAVLIYPADNTQLPEVEVEQQESESFFSRLFSRL